MAMVDDQGAAGIIQIRVGQGDDAWSGGPDFGADISRYINPKVWPSGLTVEHPLAAVNTGDRANSRPLKVRQKIQAIIKPVAGGSDQSAIIANSLQNLGRWCDLFRGQAVDTLNIILTLFDCQLPCA